jgi:hypothetical protein
MLYRVFVRVYDTPDIWVFDVETSDSFLGIAVGIHSFMSSFDEDFKIVDFAEAKLDFEYDNINLN